MKHLFFFILIVSFVASHAQEKYTLSGYVSEKTTGEKLLGVNITVGTKGAITNEYGYYSITLPKGAQTILISYIGFQNISREIDLQKSITLNFELEDNLDQLDEVVISGNSASKKVTSTQMSVSTISAKTIQKLPMALGEPDLLKSIQLLPGVSSVNEASSGFNVRGGSADQNLILLDEATIYNASHLFGFFSVFNTNAIKDLKLYKGGIPSIYGGRLSSVLDIKQKEGNTKKFGGEVGIGLISSKALIEGPLFKGNKDEAKGSYMIAGRRSYIDLFSFLNDEFKDTTLFFYDLNLKANYGINDKNTLFLSGYFGRDHFELNNFIGTVWGNASGTLRWTSILNDKLFLSTSAIFSNYDYTIDNLRSGSDFRWKSNITNYNIKPRLTWYLNTNNTLKAGIDYTYYNFKPGEISPLNGSVIQAEKFQEKFSTETGFYLDLKQNLSDKISLQYGARISNFNRKGNANIPVYENGTPLSYDDTQNIFIENEIIDQTEYKSGDNIKTFWGFEPRFSLRYLVDDQKSIKFSYNKMYQYLHLISNTSSPTPLDIWAPSGPFLKPQSADQFALGYFQTLKDDKYDFNVEVYHKSLKNTTDFIDGADLLFTENIETQIAQGDGRAYGLELQLNKNQGRLTGWLSYTLSRSERKIQSINNSEYYPTNNDQLHELNLVGLYKLNERWEFGANFIFGSGRPVTYPTGKYKQNGLVITDFENRNGDRLPAYHRLDISATLNPKPKKRGTWVFSIANVYNRQNAASIYFREISEVNDKEIATGRTEATKLSFFGIVPTATYRINF